jgi:plasmid stabilization system protein ParE
VAYEVKLTVTARADADSIYDWVVAEAPLSGPVWFEELLEALGSLDKLPLRCPQAREAAEAGRDIRCLIFGRSRHRYRILYAVDERRRTVSILHIRHGALRDLDPTDL